MTRWQLTPQSGRVRRTRYSGRHQSVASPYRSRSRWTLLALCATGVLVLASSTPPITKDTPRAGDAALADHGRVRDTAKDADGAKDVNGTYMARRHQHKDAAPTPNAKPRGRQHHHGHPTHGPGHREASLPERDARASHADLRSALHSRPSDTPFVEVSHSSKSASPSKSARAEKEGSEPAPQPPPRAPIRSCVSNAMGIPSSGAYVGAAVSGTQSLPALEHRMSAPVAIHRMYFRADQVDYAISKVKKDLAVGRLPWISFKMPYSWADMAAGRGDAWVEDLADQLASVGGPVWLAFHHEPETDGPIQDWKRMQQHLAPIIHDRTNNVAYTVILIAWTVFFGPNEYRIDSIWPGDQYVDILGVDVYNEYGAKPSRDMLDIDRYFQAIGGWAGKHNVPWAIGETAYTASAARVNPNWLQREYASLKAEGGIALSYFDSSLNSIANWTLDDRTRLSDFRAILAKSTRLC